MRTLARGPRTVPKKPDARKPITRFLLLSDLHCGSTKALCPPNFPLADDGYWGQTQKQAWIWDRWCEFGEWATRNLGADPWGMIVNGDLIEGVHHKTKEVIHYDTGVHIAAAAAVLAPFAKRAARVFVTKGTEAHTGHTSEIAIGAMIGAVPDPNHDNDTIHAAEDWQIQAGTHLMSVWHHCSATSREWLESSEYSRFISHEQLQCSRAGHPVPSIFVRAHRHVPGVFQSPSGTAIVTPAWQILTRFGRKAVPGARCFVGGCIIDTSTPVPTVAPWWKPEPPRKVYVALS